MELPVEHGLLLDNLLDLAHAPFTHTSTFAKGWSVPRYGFQIDIDGKYNWEEEITEFLFGYRTFRRQVLILI